MLPPIPTNAFQLTQEQSFEIAKMRAFIEQVPREALEALLLDSMVQNYIMRNVVSGVAKGVLGD